MAWSHDGSVDLGHTIIDAAADAGADAINVHVTHLPSYMAATYGAKNDGKATSIETSDVFRYLESINLSFPQIKELVEHARSRKLEISCLVNDPDSLDFVVRECAPDLLTIHPSSILEERFVRDAAMAGPAMIIYAGGLRLGELDQVINWAASESNERLMIQHGFQSYPTPIEYNRLAYIRTLKRLFGLPVCFADHTDGGDPMALVVPLLAVAAGADAVEKHITHDRSKKGEDYEAALDPADFKVFVERLRLSEAAIGDEEIRKLTDVELRYRSVVRKRAVFVKDLPAGSDLLPEAVMLKRSDSGLYPEEIAPLIGRMKLARDVRQDEAVGWDMLVR
ncbi:MAG: N-acetylneuraminate synthase family protein [Planctomycetales bacterium]|nr:N-acetylneuraminate synthase family protein [Planctomycetales bacterium]